MPGTVPGAVPGCSARIRASSRTRNGLPPVSACTACACSAEAASPAEASSAATATGGSPVSTTRSEFAAAGSIRISPPPRSAGGAGSRQVARISIRTPRSWRTRCASSSSDGSSAHWMSSSTSSRPSGSAAWTSRSRTSLNRAKRCPRSSSEPLPRSCPAVPPNTSDHRPDPGSSPRRPGRSCKASRHNPYGGEISRSLERAQATAAPRAAATAAVSSASRVLPIPASPAHSSRRPTPARASSSKPVTRASSRSRPANEPAAVPSSRAATTTA